MSDWAYLTIITINYLLLFTLWIFIQSRFKKFSRLLQTTRKLVSSVQSVLNKIIEEEEGKNE